MPQYPHVFLPVDVEMVEQGHLVLREGSGLVCAQNIYGTKILDGVQILDDGLFPGHADRALGKAGGHDHGQHFRGKPHRDGEREQGRFHPVALGKAVDEQHDGNHDQHETDQHPGDLVDALFKTGPDRLGADAFRHLAEDGGIAGGHAHPGGAAADDV